MLYQRKLTDVHKDLHKILTSTILSTEDSATI